MLSGEFVKALESCVKNKNDRAFGLLVCSEVITQELYTPSKNEDLSILLEFIRRNFANLYLHSSIREINEFLADHKFCERSTDGKMSFPINSICQSLLISSIGRSRSSTSVVPAQPPRGQGSRDFTKDDEKYKELPSQRRIIEIRDLWGKLKVFFSWYVIWNTMHQIILDLCVAIFLCNGLGACTNRNLILLNVMRVCLGAVTSAGHMSIRMNHQARKRWMIKYGSY
jgi:hypothetical protein